MSDEEPDLILTTPRVFWPFVIGFPAVGIGGAGALVYSTHLLSPPMIIHLMWLGGLVCVAPMAYELWLREEVDA